jgi:uncharacterized protein involved in exopolysaccharide biosynthesis
MAADDWKRELTEIIFGRMPIIVWATLCITVGTLALALLSTPTYEAKGSLIVRSKTAQTSTGSLNAPDGSASDLTENDLISEQQLLLSGALIQRTIVRLQEQGQVESPADALGQQTRGLPAIKKWLSDLLARGDDADDSAAAEMAEGVERILKTALSVSVVQDSNVIRLRVRGSDPGRTEQFLDTLMSEYLHYRLEILHPPGQGRFFRERRDVYGERLKVLEAERVAATDAASVTDLENGISNNIDLETTLVDRHNQLRNLYMGQEQQVAMLGEALKKREVTHFAFLENMVLDNLNEQLMTLTIERGRMERQFLPESPQIQALNRNIESVAVMLRAEVQTIYRDATQKLRTLAAQIKLLEFSMAELNDRTDSLQTESMRFRQLSREADLLRVSYESFARRSEEAEISEAVGASEASGDVTVLNRPAFSASKTFPKVPMIALLGLLAGLTAGCGIAFVTEHFDHTIRRASDVALFTSLPVIGSIRRVDRVMQANRKSIFRKRRK